MLQQSSFRIAMFCIKVASLFAKNKGKDSSAFGRSIMYMVSISKLIYVSKAKIYDSS